MRWGVLGPLGLYDNIMVLRGGILGIRLISGKLPGLVPEPAHPRLLEAPSFGRMARSVT